MIDSKFCFFLKKKEKLAEFICIWPAGHRYETYAFLTGSDTEDYGSSKGSSLGYLNPKDTRAVEEVPLESSFSIPEPALWDSHSGPKHCGLELVPVLFLPSTVGKG